VLSRAGPVLLSWPLQGPLAGCTVDGDDKTRLEQGRGSLWSAVHDAVLTSIVPSSSTVRLTLVVPYTESHSQQLEFVWAFSGIQSVIVRHAGGQDVDALQRMMSRIGAEDFDIVDGEASDGPPVAISISGVFIDSGDSYVIDIRAAALTVTRSDGAPTTLSGMLALGDAYWGRHQ
jgi:hypothetical protein